MTPRIGDEVYIEAGAPSAMVGRYGTVIHGPDFGVWTVDVGPVSGRVHTKHLTVMVPTIKMTTRREPMSETVAWRTAQAAAWLAAVAALLTLGVLYGLGATLLGGAAVIAMAGQLAAGEAAG